MDCHTCRGQFAEAGREDDVPCDGPEGWDACPYSKFGYGSPGNPGPDGCGLAPENVQAVQFYSQLCAIGDKAWDLIDLELHDAADKDAFAAKIAMINNYQPAINQAVRQDQEAKQELERAKTSRRQTRRKAK